MGKKKHEHDVYCLVRAAVQGPESLRDLLREKPDLVSARTSVGETALHYLAIENQSEAVRALARHGSNVNDPDDFGMTPLMSAASLHHVDICSLLLELGGDPNQKDENGDSCLHFAAMRGAERIVELLLEAGADVHHRNEIEESFLDVALPRKRSEILRVLAARGIEEGAL